LMWRPFWRRVAGFSAVLHRPENNHLSIRTPFTVADLKSYSIIAEGKGANEVVALALR